MNQSRRYILRNADIRERAAGEVSRLPLADGDKPRFEVVIKPYKRNRSLSQNSLFHMWMQHLSTGYAETHGGWHAPEVWKEHVKALFLGQESHAMPNEKVVTITRHTSELSVGEFTEFLEKVDMWCADELSLMLPHPIDMYAEAMGRRV